MLRDVFPQNFGMEKMNEKKYMIGKVSLINIRNKNEVKVVETMKRILPDYPKFDNCMLCIQDVYALSLNKIMPKYIQDGTVIFRKADDETLIDNAVRSAINMVAEKPNHP